MQRLGLFKSQGQLRLPYFLTQGRAKRQSMPLTDRTFILQWIALSLLYESDDYVLIERSLN